MLYAGVQMPHVVFVFSTRMLAAICSPCGALHYGFASVSLCARSDVIGPATYMLTYRLLVCMAGCGASSMCAPSTRMTCVWLNALHLAGCGA
jgi:hypothetical protein